jgi:predicted anti-sigma-YlaC factor YlaD
MFESCLEIRRHFWSYLDGECDRSMFRSIRYHLDYCASCRMELERIETLKNDLDTLPARRVPPELALRLRVKLSRHLHQNLFDRFLVFVDNALKPLLLPASGGVLAAILCFALIMGSQIIPSAGMTEDSAQSNQPPRVQMLAPINFPTGEEGIVVVTHIDAEGRVLSYRVLSGSYSPQVLRHLDRMMYFSHFRPAMMDGKPTDGQVVLSLRQITVRG